jgi:hypothetical protein
MSIDTATIEWLKKGALFEAATDAGVAAAWGATAVEAEIISPLATSAAAATEAARQQAFWEGPMAVETHDVPGLRSDLLGLPVTIVADRLGYEGGLAVFVIGVEEAESVRRTQLTVLRRLA